MSVCKGVCVCVCVCVHSCISIRACARRFVRPSVRQIRFVFLRNDPFGLSETEKKVHWEHDLRHRRNFTGKSMLEQICCLLNLDASSYLFKKICPSISLSVCPPVCTPIRPSPLKKEVEQSSDNRCVLAICPRTCLLKGILSCP